MSNDCDHCGLDDSHCKCYIEVLEKRIDNLAHSLQLLTLIIEQINDKLEGKK